MVVVGMELASGMGTKSSFIWFAVFASQELGTCLEGRAPSILMGCKGASDELGVASLLLCLCFLFSCQSYYSRKRNHLLKKTFFYVFLDHLLNEVRQLGLLSLVFHC